MSVKSIKFIFCAAFAVALIIYYQCEEDRFVHYLEARGYSDVKTEHPTQFNCLQGWTSAYSYRARSPSGTPVHGGACVLFFATGITEPIEKYSARR
ncbi:MAG TPA: hypothetical protein VHF01_04815 [Candidatus Acidoferrum sp.]|nr:hypothetical protein [Candidatus Acidoferrum sp.]